MNNMIISGFILPTQAFNAITFDGTIIIAIGILIVVAILFKNRSNVHKKDKDVTNKETEILENNNVSKDFEQAKNTSTNKTLEVESNNDEQNDIEEEYVKDNQEKIRISR